MRTQRYLIAATAISHNTAVRNTRRNGQLVHCFDEAILRQSAMQKVDDAELAHVSAIAELEKMAEPKLDEAASPLMVSYKEKLVVLDDAIAECQANIDHNRQNAQLRKQLLAIYSEKQRTLQDGLREETHANP